MNNLYSPAMNADLAQWLNKKTASSNHRIVLLDGFIYMIKKLKQQGTVRLNQKGVIHNRFWKSLDKTLDYKLYRKNTKRAILGSLYQFYFHVLIEEDFISSEDYTAKLTEKGLRFLQWPQQKQLDILLKNIW